MNEITPKRIKAWGKSFSAPALALHAEARGYSTDLDCSAQTGMNQPRLGVRLYGKLVEETKLYSILNDNRSRPDFERRRTGEQYTGKSQPQLVSNEIKSAKNLLLNLGGLGMLTWSFPLYLIGLDIFFSVFLGLMSAFIFVYLPLNFVDPENRMKGLSFLKKSLIVVYFFPLPLVLSAFILLIVQAVFELPMWGISALFEACASDGCSSRFSSDNLYVLPYGPGT